MSDRLDSPRVFRVGEHNRTSRKPSIPARQPSGCYTGHSPEWHVVATTYGQQLSCENELTAAGWKVLCPLHLQRRMRHPDKIIPLFSNYLFVRWHRDSDWGAVRRVRHVWHVLQSEPGCPSVLPDSVVEDLQRRMSARRIVDDPLEQPLSYKPGTKLVVQRGPLTGLAGVCSLHQGARVRLLFDLLGKEMTQDFAPLDLMPES
jgi:transcription antitermination factor NusG